MDTAKTLAARLRELLQGGGVMDIITINLNEGRDWGDCALCEGYRRLDHAIGYYCGPTYDDPGTKLLNGDEVGGRLVCRRCHDAFYYNRPTPPEAP